MADLPERAVRIQVAVPGPEFPSLAKIVREISRSRVVTPDELLKIAEAFDKKVIEWNRRGNVVAQG